MIKYWDKPSLGAGYAPSYSREGFPGRGSPQSRHKNDAWDAAFCLIIRQLCRPTEDIE